MATIARRANNNHAVGFDANQARAMAEYASMNRQYNKWENAIRKAARRGRVGITTVQFIPSEIVSRLKEANFTVDTRRIEDVSANPSQFEKFETKIMW